MKSNDVEEDLQARINTYGSQGGLEAFTMKNIFSFPRQNRMKLEKD